jgi:hypothetical protein
MKGVRSGRYGPAHPNGASSGGAFGFWRLSAREGTRRLGRFRVRGRLMGAKSSQRSRRSGRWRGDSGAVGRSDATAAYFDGTAGTPSVCRAVLAVVLGRHVLRTCVRLCGCAGGSYPSHPASPVHQPHGSEALGVNEPQPRDLKLASVYWHDPAVRAERNRRIRHIPDGQRAPGDVSARL